MLLYTLSHPHVVPLLGVFEAPGNRLGLLMPFVDMDLEWWLGEPHASCSDNLCGVVASLLIALGSV